MGKSAGMKIGNNAYYYFPFLGKDSFVHMNTVCNRLWTQPFFVFPVSLTGLAFSHVALCEMKVQNKLTTHFTVETSLESTSLK